MRQVYIARDTIEAQSIKDCLHEVGIESVVQGEYLSAAWGALPIAPETSPSVWVVRDDDFDKAIECVELLKRNSPDRPTTGWKCERCGEMIDAQFTECWKCAAEPTAIATATPHEMTPTPDDDGGATADESEPPPQIAREYDTCARSDRDLWIEASVVILFFVVTALYGAVAILFLPEVYRDRSSLNHSLSFLVTDAANIGLVIYLIWRSAESWSGFGLVRPRWLMDTLLGLAFWGTAWAIHGASWRVVDGLFGPDFFETANHDDAGFVPIPNGIVAVVAFVFSVCVSAFAEELVMRAYLVPRFERLLGSSTRSIFVTAGLFASYHIYQGIDGAVSAFIMGLVYGTMFLWSRRLWPVAVAHSISNLLVFWSSFAERV